MRNFKLIVVSMLFVALTSFANENTGPTDPAKNEPAAGMLGEAKKAAENAAKKEEVKKKKEPTTAKKNN